MPDMSANTLQKAAKTTIAIFAFLWRGWSRAEPTEKERQ
jgi:hypothetical protein